REQIMRVALAHAGGVGDRADLVVGDTAQLLARVVLLDLLLHRRRELDAGLLEEADVDDLGVDRARADVEAELVAVRLQEVAADGGREDAQGGHVDPGRIEARDDRPLDHAAGRGRLAARDAAGAALQRRPERGGEPDRRLDGEVDVDEARDAVLAEEPRRGARLPDQALVDLRARLDLLVRVDADPRGDHALRADHEIARASG